MPNKRHPSMTSFTATAPVALLERVASLLAERHASGQRIPSDRSAVVRAGLQAFVDQADDSKEQD